MDAAGWDKRYADADLVWSEGPNQFVVAQAQDLSPGTALDAGCGEGRNALWLAEQGWTVTGWDFSKVALDRARARSAERGVSVSWEQRDLTTWSPGATFDLVLLAYIHLGPLERAELVECARAAVSPGGHLLIIGHDLRNLDDGIGGPQDPALLWQPHEVEPLGWDVVRSETAVRIVDEATAWDTVVDLRRP